MAQAKVKVQETAQEEQSAIAAMGRAAMGVVETATEQPAKAFDLGASLSARMTQKRQVVETAKATLAEAIALEGNANTANGAVAETQAKAINILAQGVIAGLIDKPQVSAMLGDAYGYKAKADGTPGKAPDGAGGSLRKRVVTLSEAFAYVNGDIAEDAKPRWLEGKSAEAIAPIVTQWLEGNESPWGAYKSLTEREKGTAVALQFDHAKLLKLAEAINDAPTMEAIRGNPALVAVYTAICEAFLATPDAPIDF